MAAKRYGNSMISLLALRPMFSDGFLNLMSKAEMKTSFSDVTVFEEQIISSFRSLCL